MYKAKEKTAEVVFLVCALTTVLSFMIITVFIFGKGLPAIFHTGVFQFLFGTKWAPKQDVFGIFPMIVASFMITFFSFLFGSFIGKWSAIYLAFYAPRSLYRIVKPMIELLAGIPSVIYGFFGLIVIVPWIRETFGGTGKSMLAAIIILTIMILPTIINLSESTLRAVPQSYYEGAVSLGTTHNEAVFKVMVPAAKSGILASYILGMGRALGETMAVILVAGNSVALRLNPLKAVRSMTAGIAMEMGYAEGLHQQALFGIGVVLFVFIFILNLYMSMLSKRGEKL